MIDRIETQLVRTIPKDPLPGVLYVSVEYATTLHLCACGCGHEVVLGISPKDWQLCWDGETVTLDPSVGNWSFPCQSHYLIRRSRIVRAGQWNDEQIARGRAMDAVRKRPEPAAAPPPAPLPAGVTTKRPGWLHRLRRQLRQISRR